MKSQEREELNDDKGLTPAGAGIGLTPAQQDRGPR